MSSSNEEPAEAGPAEDQVDKLGRKVWDKEYFAKRAAEKTAVEGEDVDLSLLPEAKKKKLPPPPACRRHLSQRQYELNLDSELGKMKVVTAHTPKQGQGGYWCEVCECLIKDSQAFLDHINGKRHNRLLGMTMKVERVSVQQVRDKLRSLKSKEMGGSASAMLDEQDIESRLEQLRQEEEGRKRRKMEKRKLKQSARPVVEEDESEEEEDDGEGIRKDDAEEDEERKMLKEMGLPMNFS